MSKVIYKASCWDCDDYYIGKTNVVVFEALTNIADHVTSTGHIKWDHFKILSSGLSVLHCKVKETLLIRDLKPSMSVNILAVKTFFFISLIIIIFTVH